MRLKVVLFLAAGLLCHRLEASQETEFARRLFDFTPVSTNNPVVAIIDHSIEIPASEFFAYQKAEHLSSTKTNLNLAQKKEMLNDLIGEYLLIDAAYKSGADKQPAFTNRMQFTRTMLLSDFLVAREVDAKAKTADEYNQLLDGLKKRLFDAAQIDISNEAYDQLKAAAQKINRAGESLPDAADRKNAAAAQTREIMETMPDAVLARYNGTPITVKQTLAVYAQLHPPRPNLETNEALVEFLKPFILPGLMTAEAERLGIEKLPAFQDKIIQNRNTLLRFYMHSLIEAKANEELQSLGLDQQMKSWYEQHAARYAAPGAKKFPAYADVRERVEGDYSVDLLERLRAEKIRALREMHHIQIDEAALKTARAETTTHP